MKLRILIAGLLIGVAALAADNGAELFQKAVTQERAAGNLEEAIKLYQRVAKEFASDRALAAKALVAQARCYEKLGQDKAAQATKLYEQVARDYRDQPDQSATARDRLAALGAGNKPKAGAGMTAHQIPIPSTASNVYSDGRHVFYADREAGGLVAAKMDGTGPHLILPLHGRSIGGPMISVSPDGRQIAVKLREADHNAYGVVAVDGTGYREIFRDPINGKLAVGGWSPDGTHFLGHIIEPDGSHTVAIISAADGSVRKVKDSSVNGAWIGEGGGGIFSPDGKYVVFALLKEGTSQQSDIHVLAIDGSYGGKLVDHPSSNLPIDFTPDGRHLLFQSDRSGLAGIYSLAVSNGRAQGEPMLVKPEAGIFNFPGSITKDGTLFYSLGRPRHQIFNIGLDAARGTLAGAPQVFAAPSGMIAESGAWSPNGQEFAWLSGLNHNSLHDEGDTRLTIRGIASGKDIEYEVPPATSAVLGWTADGRGIYTVRFYGAPVPDPRAELHSITVENGVDKLLTAIPGATGIYSVRPAPDGNALLISYGGDPSAPVRDGGLIRLDPQTGRQTEIVPKGVVSEIAISLDGTQIAALDRQAKSASLLIKPVVGGEWKTLATLEGTGYMYPYWMPNGSIIFGKEGFPNSALFRTSVSGGATEKLGELPSLSHVHEIRLHPDGRQLMFQSYVTHTELWALENFLPKELAAR